MLRRNKKRSYRAAILIASVVLVLAVGGGITLSYITTTDDPIENTFTPALVSCSVDETFEDGVKRDVSIRNTGNVNAYIRASVIITWKSEDDSSEILATQPKEGVDYTVEYSDSSWIQGGDGFFYYSEAVAPGANTDILIQRLTPISEAPEGYSLSVEILASALQSEPSDVVAKQWNVTVTNGVLTPKS